jgi:hypothetical protein
MHQNEDSKKLIFDKIDLIFKKVKNIDLAFLCLPDPVTENAQESKEGFFYLNEQLKPKAIFPMGLEGNEFLYKEFYKEGFNNIVYPVENRGDVVFYQNGKVK